MIRISYSYCQNFRGVEEEEKRRKRRACKIFVVLRGISPRILSLEVFKLP